MNLERMRSVVTRLKEADKPSAENRAAINRLYNGDKPWTESEAQDGNIFTNVQPLMAPRIAMQARQQLNRATMYGPRRFTVDVDIGRPEEAAAISQQITNLINRPLNDSRPYRELMRGVDATLFLHGRGLVIWDDDHAWTPKVLGIEDLKVPAGAYADFSNVSHFAIFQRLSAAELWRKISGKTIPVGWNEKRIKQLITKLAGEVLTEYRSANAGYFPEKLAEDLKQNGAYWGGTTVPPVECWWFYELDERDGKLAWRKYLFTDSADGNLKEAGDEESFLYKNDKSVVEHLSQLVQIQYADGCNVAPFMYHSVRGPGYLLYPVLQLLNRLFCRSVDSINEACNQLFRNVGEADREKLMQVVLGNMSVVPTGVDFVPANERYTVNHNLLDFGMRMLRQFISENAVVSAFTDGQETQRTSDMTATEVTARVQRSAQLVQGIVAAKADYQRDQYREIARRFTIKSSRDEDVRTFQEECRKAGIPEKAWDFKRWTIRVDVPLGGGNRLLELAAARELLMARQAFSPQAQQQILRIWTTALLEDPKAAYELVPMEPQGPSKTTMFANLAVGTLLQSVPVTLEPWIVIEEYALTIFGALQVKIMGLVQAQIQPEPETIGGIMFTAQHLEQVIGQIGSDPAKADMARQMMKQLAELLKPVEEWQAAAQSDPMAGIPPEARAKVQTMMLEAETKSRIKEADAAQKRKNLEDRSRQRAASDRLSVLTDLERKDLETAQNLRHSEAEFQQGLRQSAVETATKAAGELARRKSKPEGGSDAT